jgi:hypothetical protein
VNRAVICLEKFKSVGLNGSMLLRKTAKLSIVGISLALALILSIGFASGAFSVPMAAQKRQVTLTAILDDQGDPQRAMKMWFQPALTELRARHPDIDIKLDYRPIPYLVKIYLVYGSGCII